MFKNRIAIEQDLTTTEKSCILAEELAHGEITVGNILDQSETNNRRQEQKARTLAVVRRVQVWQLADALHRGYRSITDIAEYLNVTEEFLVDAIGVFHRKYGVYARVGDDVLMLEPTVALLSHLNETP